MRFTPDKISPHSVPRFGWRMWRLSEDGYLTSKWGGRESYRSTLVTAECAVYGCVDVPGPNCRCGIYFVEDIDAMLRETFRLTEFERSYNPEFPMPVLTLVEPVGRTVDAPIEPVFSGAKVWRAAQVRLAAIVIDTRMRRTERAEHLANAYGIPVHVGITRYALQAAEDAHRLSAPPAAGHPSLTNPFTSADVVGIGGMMADRSSDHAHALAPRSRCGHPGCNNITGQELCPIHRQSAGH
ncbi:hypothetical protein C8E05_3818 [Rhodococcus wratislaviensis]|uniref:RES domain-containing protein n=1 Tax=Rhodococcus wratislaviensis TaxID=44752 RepID=A0AB38FKC8_RHOWR|nr:hypothetical protein [Rhodococcus wratislaviensis]REE74383.1 hypothetical protein C8E05_3818 [Rhodococcus wratislaviensis]SPZ42080.1 Uncharacterised protein [Rhodococcus wratislaviensis]